MCKPAERSLGAMIALVVVLIASLHMDRAGAQSVALVMEEGALRSACAASAHPDDSAARRAGRLNTLRRCSIAQATPEDVRVIGVLMGLSLVATLGGFYAAVRASWRPYDRQPPD